MKSNERLGAGIVKYIMEYVQGEEFENRMKIDDCGKDKMYRSGFIQGMLWGATLISYFLNTGKFFTIKDNKK